jgi:hypothetical protein
MIILNLTQHVPTPEQQKAGVIDLAPEDRDKLIKLLNFKTLPTKREIVDRGEAIYDLIYGDVGDDNISYTKREIYKDVSGVMIGGFIPLCVYLESIFNRIKVVYAFSERVSIETTNKSGEVIKTSKFVHKGFVQAPK